MMYKYRIKNIANDMITKMLGETEVISEICLSHSVVRRSRVSAHTQKGTHQHLFSYGTFSQIASFGRQIIENGSADNLLTAPSDSQEQAHPVPWNNCITMETLLDCSKSR